MYIETLKLFHVRTFVNDVLTFVHPDMKFCSSKSHNKQNKPLLPKPILSNVNLLLGDNGSGKSTVLQTIALASLGPAAEDAQLPVRKLVRFGVSSSRSVIRALFLLHNQDGKIAERRPESESTLQVERVGELERLTWNHDHPGTSNEQEAKTLWHPAFESKNQSFFCVAYGATRRVDAGESVERGSPPKTRFVRGQRLQSIFQDSFALFPLIYWLPQLRAMNPGRYRQVERLLNLVLKPGHCRFTGEIEEQEYLFEQGGMRVPFRSLSDGHRAFIAWVADLLFHVCYGCPSGKRLTESKGIVLVDEIDLHLHPKWQMQVIRVVAKALPRMQFVFTSHSPLIVGSVEWMNIVTLKTRLASNRTIVKRLQQGIHGLDADQILLTQFFGLETTRARSKRRQLDALRERARAGDREAARSLILAMARGTEENA